MSNLREAPRSLLEESESVAAAPSPAPSPATSGDLRPYDDLAGYLADVSREVIARIEANAALRALRCGVRVRRSYGEPLPPPREVIQLSAEEIRVLAHGGTITRGAAELSCASLPDVAQLRIEQWQAIADAARSVRQARSAVSPDQHPSRGLLAMEAALGTEWDLAAAVVLMTVSPASCLVAQVFRRHLYGLGDFNARSLLSACYGDPLLRLDVVDALGPDHPWFRLGLVEWDATQAPEEILERNLRPGVVFINRALGRSDLLPGGPGVRLLRSTVSLDDVVLEDYHRQMLAGVDLSLARRSGRSVGILLTGPSGTGKTLLAQALAQRADKPLVMLDPERFRSRGDEPFSEGDDQVLTNLLRRAAMNDLPVFIDEADDLISDGTAESQVLLTALDRTPVTIILATNNPERLDPALDRRMQVRLRFTIPSAALRERIVRRELQCQGWPMDQLPSDEALRRLARAWPLSGGYWANGVRGVLGRALALQQAPTVDDLQREMAQIAGSFDGRTWPSGWQWELGGPSGDGCLLSPSRQRHIRQVAAALADCRRQGLGATVFIHGPDEQLFMAAARLLAEELEALLLRYTGSSPASAAASGGDGLPNKKPRTESDEIPTLPVSAEEQPLIVLPARLEPSEAQRVMTAWPLQGYLLLRHQPDAADEEGLAAIEVDWAAVDAEQAQHLWAQWGAQGAPPVSNSLAALQAAFLRQRLAGLGRRPSLSLP